MARLAATVLALLVLSAACSKGDDDDSAPDEGTTSNNQRPSTSSVPDEPPGTEPVEVAPHIQALLKRYDDAVTKIVADPSVVENRDDPVVEEFLSLFEAGSDFAEGSLEGWASYVEDGTTLKPLVADYPVNVTRLEGPPQAVDEDEIGFGQCTTLNYVSYKDDKEQKRVDRELLPGNGRAVRVDGHWLLVDLSTPQNMQGCFTGSGVPR